MHFIIHVIANKIYMPRNIVIFISPERNINNKELKDVKAKKKINSKQYFFFLKRIEKRKNCIEHMYALAKKKEMGRNYVSCWWALDALAIAFTEGAKRLHRISWLYKSTRCNSLTFIKHKCNTKCIGHHIIIFSYERPFKPFIYTTLKKNSHQKLVWKTSATHNDRWINCYASTELSVSKETRCKK